MNKEKDEMGQLIKSLEDNQQKVKVTDWDNGYLAGLRRYRDFIKQRS